MHKAESLAPAAEEEKCGSIPAGTITLVSHGKLIMLTLQGTKDE